MLEASIHTSYSIGDLSLEEVADGHRDNAEMKDGVGKVGKGADHLSVMYLPCQDPLLVKIYQDLPTLPCVFFSIQTF